MVVRKACHVVGILLLVSTLFLVLSVSSYSPGDPTGNCYMSQGKNIVRNLGGDVGAGLADWTLQAFGRTVVLLAGIALLGAWCLFRGRFLTAVAVAGRGLLCFAAVSACVYLTFTHDPMWGTAKMFAGEHADCAVQILAGGIVGKWLADSAVASLSHFGVASLSRPGAYVILGIAAFGGLCVGVKHPLLTALWRGLRSIGRGSWALVGFVPQGLAGIGWVVRQGRASAKCLRGAITRLRQSDIAPPSSMPSSHVHERTEPLLPPMPVSQSSVSSEGQSNVTCIVSSVRQVPLSPVQPSAVVMRKRQVVVPKLPPMPAAPPPDSSEAWSSAAYMASSACQAPVPPAQPSAAVVRKPPAVLPTPPPRHPHAQRAVDVLPSLDLLDRPAVPQRGQSPEALATQARFLEQKLREFGVEGEVVQVLPGPVISMYEFAPAAGVKVNKIVTLQDDLALVMEAVSVRVVAPIPGKAVVGIEIPHKRRETVCLRDLLDSEEYRTSTSKLSLALGKDILGRPVITDLALIPHLLIAGATGSGKSVGLNSLICSLLFRATPADVRMIMIDPKMLEFSVYDGIPHLLVPVVTDPKKAAVVLRRVVEEMGRRYHLLAAQGVRSIAQYNQMLEEEQRAGSSRHPRAQAGDEAPPMPAEKLPYLVVVIDELSDLMMISAREVEDSLMRLAQMARAAGIHLIVATQRPSVDVLTGVIKANFPARLSFQVTSKVDSRTILDTNGAETLLGRGDMLFLAPGTSKPQRVHGAYVSEAEISRLVEAWKAVEQTRYDDGFLAPGGDRGQVEEDEYDEKYDEAIALVTKIGQASISMLQRRLRVGYNRAARMIAMMEKEGVVGPADGMKPREVLVRNTFDD